MRHLGRGDLLSLACWGWVFRRFGFGVSSGVQALLFLTAHLLLFLITAEIRRILTVEGIAG